MKKIKYISLAVLAFASTTLFTSCEDEDKLRFPELGNGGFVKFVSMPEFDAGADATTASFTASTEDPNNNVANYEVKVRGFFTGAPTDTIAFRSTTTFPFDVSFTGSDMASLFGVDVSTFEQGDSFEFFGIVTTNDGLVYDGTRAACDCPAEPLDPLDPTQSNGTWNGGMTDNVLLTQPTLLQAFNWEVELEDPTE